jgi:transposase
MDQLFAIKAVEKRLGVSLTTHLWGEYVRVVDGQPMLTSTIEEIAVDLEIDPTTLRRYFDRMGIHKARPRWAPIRFPEAVAA